MNVILFLIIGTIIGIVVNPYIPDSVIKILNPYYTSTVQEHNDSIKLLPNADPSVDIKNNEVKEILKTHVETNINNDPLIKQLENAESYFESTIRSCLGENCFDEEVKIKENNERKEFVRIGILSPSESISKG